MLRPKGLDHVGLVVTDLDRSLRFYCEGLGLQLLRTSGPNADGVGSAVLKVGEQEINIFSGASFGPADGARSFGIDHFWLNVDGVAVDHLIAELRKAGVEVVKGPVQRRDGISVFVHDPDGVRVELRVANERDR